MPAIGKVVQFTQTCRLCVVNQWHFIDFFFPENKPTQSIIDKNRALDKKALPERK